MIDTPTLSAWESIVHILELPILALVATAAWAVIRTANRILDVLQEYPPHRHANGTIIYPTDMAPGRVEKS